MTNEELAKRFIKNSIVSLGTKEFFEQFRSGTLSASNAFIWDKTQEGWRFWYNFALTYVVNRDLHDFLIANYFNDNRFVDLYILV